MRSRHLSVNQTPALPFTVHKSEIPYVPQLTSLRESITPMAALFTTTPAVRTPPADPPKPTSAAVFSSISGFASRQGWQEGIRRVVAFVFDHVRMFRAAYTYRPPYVS